MPIEVKNNKTANKIHFSDLKIGDCYRDEDGLLCIKTSASHCIFLSPHESNSIWDTAYESEETLVTLVKATLTIEE